jgi:phosphatidylglycerol---prolipoprotein diacylglyceryl transferase
VNMRPLIPYFTAQSIDVFGAFTVQPFGVLLVAGIVTGSVVAVHEARRHGLNTEVMIGFLPWLYAALLIGGVLGERVLYHPRLLLEDPMALLRMTGGVSSTGGLAMAAVLAFWYFRSQQRALRYADALIGGVLIAIVVARIGCFIVHDHPGVETRFWLGVQGICPSGGDVACHDVGLYEAALALILFVGARVCTQVRRPDGFVLIIFTVGYGSGRFLLEWLRHPDTDVRYYGLTPAQYGCLLLIALGMWMYRRSARTALPA